MDTKEAFEVYAREMDVIIIHYHADNGKLSDNGFIAHEKKIGQTISYCGVHAHFQNERVVKRIRDLQESARTQLLYAKARWCRAIAIDLLQYTLRVNHNPILLIKSRRKLALHPAW